MVRDWDLLWLGSRLRATGRRLLGDEVGAGWDGAGIPYGRCSSAASVEAG